MGNSLEQTCHLGITEEEAIIYRKRLVGTIQLDFDVNQCVIFILCDIHRLLFVSLREVATMAISSMYYDQ